MECKVKLKIYSCQWSFAYDNIIFEDEKLKIFNSYEEVKSAILKLAEATKLSIENNHSIDSRRPIEFDINVIIDNTFVIASYKSSYENFGEPCYEQKYKDWNAVLYVIDKQNVINKTKLSENIHYRLQTFKNFAIKNIDKSFNLKEPISNNWNAWIEGFYFSKGGKIYIDCYWQGDKTDGNKYVEYNGNPIRFNVLEKTLRNDYNHRIQFSKDQINEAILNLLIENYNIK